MSGSSFAAVEGPAGDFHSPTVRDWEPGTGGALFTVLSRDSTSLEDAGAPCATPGTIAAPALGCGVGGICAAFVSFASAGGDALPASAGADCWPDSWSM